MSWQVLSDKWMILKDMKNLDGKKVKAVFRVFVNNISGEMKFFDSDVVEARGTQVIIDELNKPPKKEEVKTDVSLEKVLEANL